MAYLVAEERIRRTISFLKSRCRFKSGTGFVQERTRWELRKTV